MHFADGATSYLRPVLMDGFYPHFAGYLGLQMWWLGSHQLSPRKVAASVGDRTGDLSHDRPQSYLDATGASPILISLLIKNGNIFLKIIAMLQNFFTLLMEKKEIFLLTLLLYCRFFFLFSDKNVTSASLKN